MTETIAVRKEGVAMNNPSESARESWSAALLAFTAGCTDTIGFVALYGLFTAHVTGNFVLLGASIVSCVTLPVITVVGDNALNAVLDNAF